MKFREYDLNDIIVVGPCNKERFIDELKEIHDKYDVIDLQYAIVSDGSAHSALVLVRSKK